MPQELRTAAGTETENNAGGAGSPFASFHSGTGLRAFRASTDARAYAMAWASLVLSSAGKKLFHPSVTALWFWLSPPRPRNGTASSFHADRWSPARTTPGTEPVVRSTSLSNDESDLNPFS